MEWHFNINSIFKIDHLYSEAFLILKLHSSLISLCNFKISFNLDLSSSSVMISDLLFLYINNSPAISKQAKTAIKAFQQEKNLQIDGLPSESLLILLQRELKENPPKINYSKFVITKTCS